MKKIIQDKLLQIEKEYEVKILYACESGSRAWGFPSSDSDYDVRFIYLKTKNEYLSVGEKEDTLGFPVNDELDIYGWDLRKVLQLVLKSNTTPFEWLQSPVVYREEAGFKEDLFALCQYFYGQRSNTHHYLGIAKGARETMSVDGMIKIKKLFYILRPLLAAKWCIEQNSIAPMNIHLLRDILPEELQQELKKLLAQKAEVTEGFLMIPADSIMNWISETEKYIVEVSKDLPRNQFNVIPLDLFFRKTIDYYDDTRP